MLWGGNFIAGSVLSDSLSGAWRNANRWCLAGVVLLPFGARGIVTYRFVLRRHILPLLLLAALGVVGFNMVLYTGLGHTSAAHAAVTFSITPILIIGLNALLDRRWPSPRITFGATLALLGMTFAQANGLRESLNLVGFFWMAAAAVIWSLYCIALRRLPVPVPLHVSFTAQVWLGLWLIAMLSILADPMPALNTLSPQTLGGLTYLGLGAAALAFGLWQFALRRVGAETAGLFMNLVPIASLGLGWALLGESLSVTELAAITLVFVGIGVASTQVSLPLVHFRFGLRSAVTLIAIALLVPNAANARSDCVQAWETVTTTHCDTPLQPRLLRATGVQKDAYDAMSAEQKAAFHRIAFHRLRAAERAQIFFIETRLWTSSTVSTRSE